jgi:sec-independent protein translocase protein TatA
MSFPGGGEWIPILLIVLLLFGAPKLPKLARSVGQSITEFRKGTREAFDGEDDADNEGDGSTRAESRRDREKER